MLCWHLSVVLLICLYYKVSTLYNIQIASSCIKVKKGKNIPTTTGPSTNGNNHLTLSPSLSKPLLYPPISSCPPPSISKSNQTPLPSVSRGIPPTYHIKLSESLTLRNQFGICRKNLTKSKKNRLSWIC